MGLTGAIIGAAGSALGGLAAFQQFRQQAEIAQQNAAFQAQVTQFNVSQIQASTAAEEARVRRDMSRRLGATRAAIGATGFTAEGTPLDVIADQAAEAEEIALLTRFGGRLQAQRARFQGSLAAREQLFTAQTARSRGGQALLGGFGRAGQTLLTGFLR